ncbi:MAG: ATP-binding protein [Planctomycetaceae bacterium]
MKLLVITNDASFFRQIHEICRTVAPSLRAFHQSSDVWAAGCCAEKNIGAFLLDGAIGATRREGKNSGIAFAVAWTLCQNNANDDGQMALSREETVLWLRELSTMTTEPTFLEDVVVQSPHVRLAQFRIPTRCDLIPVIRDRLLKGIRDYQVVEGTRENHFCMALEEALNNAFYHGNLEISSDLKEDGSSRFVDLAREREQLLPWKGRCVRITELVSSFGLWVSIQDDGAGFDVDAAIARCNDPEALLASGRGLLMMRAFSDEVFFNASGNEVTLVLYADAQDKELPLSISAETGEVTRLALNV